MAEKILEVIKTLRAGEKRNFAQSFDLIINLRDFDLKKAENKISEEIVLPYGKGEDSKVVVFSDAIRDGDFQVLTSKDIENLGRDKRAAKNVAKNTDFFLAEAKLMPLIGKTLGQFLAPRGRMPKIIAGDINASVKSLKKSIRIRIKDSPVIQCKVGNENMKDEDIEEGVRTVVKYLESKFSKARIGKVMLKLTMSEPIEVDAFG